MPKLLQRTVFFMLGLILLSGGCKSKQYDLLYLISSTESLRIGWFMIHQCTMSTRSFYQRITSIVLRI